MNAFARVLAPVAIAASLALTGGCGFSPLYAKGELTQELQTVSIETVDGRMGRLMTNQLQDLIGSGAGPATLRLTTTLDERRTPRGLTRDNTANRYELVVLATFQLHPMTGDTRPVHTGSVRTLVSYDASDQPYQGIATQQDAERRAAEDLARQIQAALILYLR